MPLTATAATVTASNLPIDFFTPAPNPHRATQEVETYLKYTKFGQL